MKKIILCIDGDYYANKTIARLNSKDKLNTLSTDIEIKNFKMSLINDLIELWEIFKPHCYSMVFCIDNNSWRKYPTPVRPYYLKEFESIGYKENRAEAKSKLPYDYIAFKDTYREFAKHLKNIGIPVMNINGLEGDDNMCLISDYFKDSHEYSVLLYANDKDISVVCNRNADVFRHIKSEDAPDGEFIVSPERYNEIFRNKVSIIKGINFNVLQYEKLFSFNYNNPKNTVPVKRSLGKGVEISTPYKTALIQSLCGDKKDNIFSVLSWPASTGTKMFKLTDNIVTKQLETMGYKTFTESDAQRLLLSLNDYDTERAKSNNSLDEMLTLIIGLCDKYKQPFNKGIIKHTLHNFKMKFLNVYNIPEVLVNEFKTEFESLNWNVRFEIEESNLKFVSQSTKTNSVMENDIPKELLNQ